jgi:hypothetical protein
MMLMVVVCDDENVHQHKAEPPNPPEQEGNIPCPGPQIVRVPGAAEEFVKDPLCLVHSGHSTELRTCRLC